MALGKKVTERLTFARWQALGDAIMYIFLLWHRIGAIEKNSCRHGQLDEMARGISKMAVHGNQDFSHGRLDGRAHDSPKKRASARTSKPPGRRREDQPALRAESAGRGTGEGS
jgi:hypothetical protein